MLAAPMSSTVERTNALDKLNDNVPSAFIWRLTLLATLGGFLFGYDTSNIGAALNFIPYKLNDFGSGYLVAGASLGAAAGALLAGPLTDMFGRKKLLIADALVYSIGAHPVRVDVARRRADGGAHHDRPGHRCRLRDRDGVHRRVRPEEPARCAEHAAAVDDHRRHPGRRTSSRGSSSRSSPVRPIDWRWFFGLGAVPAIIGLIFRFEMPESPRWLIRKGRYEDAQKAFGKLEVEVSVEDVEHTAHLLDQADAKAERDKSTVWTKGVKRALTVVCVFFVFQQITGINVPLYYGPQLLGDYFASGNSLLAMTIAGIEVTLIITAVNVISTYFAFRYIDRIGRRKLAMGGFAGMAVFGLVAAAGIGLLDGVPRAVVGMIGLSLFVSSFAIGVGGTGWLIQGEMFPTAVRGQCASIAAFCDWIANYALIEAFPAWQRSIGLSWVLVSFAGLCLAAIAFVYKFLPETKNLSVEEITDLFEKQVVVA